MKLQTESTTFLDEVVGMMGNPRRRRWCDAYLREILLDGHRKRVEPMAARLKAIEQGTEDYEHHVVLVLMAYAFLQDVRHCRPKNVAT